MSDQQIYSNGNVADIPAGLYSIRKVGFLEDAQVQVGTGHPPQLQLNSSDPAISYVLRSKPNRHPDFVPSLNMIPSPCSHQNIPENYVYFIHVQSNLPLNAPPCYVPYPLPSSLSCHTCSVLPCSRSCSCLPTPLPWRSAWHGVLRSALILG